MRDDDGRWYCDHCQTRSARGGFYVLKRGNDPGIRTRNITVGEAALYCSERCLRDATLPKNETDDDQVEHLTRIISRMERYEAARRREAREDEDYEASRIRPLKEIAAAIATIRETELTRAIDNSDQGKQLRRILDLIERRARGTL